MRTAQEKHAKEASSCGSRRARKQAAPASALRHAGSVAVLGALLVLSGCGTFSGRTGDSQGTRGATDVPRKGGGYYLDDGPGDNIPANLDAVPDAVPRWEPLHRGAARPYSVMGRSYTPMTELGAYRQRGTATWYGRRYHGQRTSSGEIYDMYAMTGAHTTLPIPSYARVTNVGNGRSVVVRINDRGPFLNDRLIDLSYVAAHKLDLLGKGAALVEVEALLPNGSPAPAATDRAAERPSAPPQVDSILIAASAAAPATAPPAAPIVARASGHYLQLGAFAVLENAQRFMERVQAQLGSFDASLVMANANNLFRVQAGPYASRAEAIDAAERIGQILGATPILAAPR